ncbi:MAG: DegT/DnrJ/EryC1/StrS family aminotransferase [Planctomycetota bacterium]
MNRVNLLDLAPLHLALEDELLAAARRVITTQRFVLGDEGRALEREIADYVGVSSAVGCASGSDALLLALRALDVDADQVVVTTPQSFFATAGAPARLGTSVDFVDVEPETMNLDPASLRDYLAGCARGADGALLAPRSGKRVTTVIAVDLFGRPCRYDQLEALCAEYGLNLIEDAAQSLGAAVGERRCGAFGRVGTLSFYPTKNLGGAGDGGMLTTSDEALAARLRSLRIHGQGAKGTYFHDEVGWNSRLDELQAALLRVKLPHLDAGNDARRAHAAAYDAAFADLAGVEPLATPSPEVRAIYHLYVVRAQRRDELRAHLDAAGIGSGVYYPLPLHLQRCFKGFGYTEGTLPVAERLSREVLALPMYAELTVEQRQRVIDAVRAF